MIKSKPARNQLWPRCRPGFPLSLTPTSDRVRTGMSAGGISARPMPYARPPPSFPPGMMPPGFPGGMPPGFPAAG